MIKVDVIKVSEVIQRILRCHAIRVRAYRRDFFHIDVVLVRNFSHQLFHQVFHRHQTSDPAVLVDHHGEVVLFVLQKAKRVVDFLALWDKHGRLGKRGNSGLLSARRQFVLDPRNIPQIANPHHVIAVFADNGNPRHTGV